MKNMEILSRGLAIVLLLAGLNQLAESHAQEAVATDAAAAAVAATPVDVEEIVRNANRMAYYQGQDGRADVKMTIVDNQGRERNREFTILRRDEVGEGGPEDDQYTGDQKFYVYFKRPADVYKMVFMVWKHLGRDDDRWLYLPALDLVKRIAAADKRTSFVGSHFFYEDVSGRSIELDTHVLEETTDQYYVLLNTPKDPGNVEFKYYRMWIHKDTFIPVKTDYYDKNEHKYRVYEALNVEEIEGYKTVTQSRMTDLQAGGSTLLDYSNVDYNQGLPEDLFTERYLRRPPRSYLR